MIAAILDVIIPLAFEDSIRLMVRFNAESIVDIVTITNDWKEWLGTYLNRCGQLYIRTHTLKVR